MLRKSLEEANSRRTNWDRFALSDFDISNRSDLQWMLSSVCSKSLRVGVCGWVWASETQLTYLATFYLVEHCSYNSPRLQMLRQCWCCQFTALFGLQMCNRELTSMFFYWIQWLFSSLNTNLSHPVLCKVARFLYNCGPSGAHTQRKMFARIGIVTCLKFKRQYGPALAGFCCLLWTTATTPCFLASDLYSSSNFLVSAVTVSPLHLEIFAHVSQLSKK